MLNDRDYMRRGNDRGSGGNEATGRTAVFALIAVTVLIQLTGGNSDSFVLNSGAFHEGDVLPLLTALFVHGGFFHLFFNMFTLYVFGSLSAPLLGGRHFVQLYLFSGIIGNLVWLASTWSFPQFSVLGASGAVMGVLMATAMLRPDVEMLILFVPFPLKLKTMALVFFGLDIVSQAGGLGGIAYMAHIGGFIAGYLYMILFLRRMIQWDPLKQLFRRKPSGPEYRGWTMHDCSDVREPGSGSSSNGPVSQQELDYLLDKISRQGINSLSETEMSRLRQAREQMKGR